MIFALIEEASTTKEISGKHLSRSLSHSQSQVHYSHHQHSNSADLETNGGDSNHSRLSSWLEGTMYGNMPFPRARPTSESSVASRRLSTCTSVLHSIPDTDIELDSGDPQNPRFGEESFAVGVAGGGGLTGGAGGGVVQGAVAGTPLWWKRRRKELSKESGRLTGASGRADHSHHPPGLFGVERIDEIEDKCSLEDSDELRNHQDSDGVSDASELEQQENRLADLMDSPEALDGHGHHRNASSQDYLHIRGGGLGRLGVPPESNAQESPPLDVSALELFVLADEEQHETNISDVGLRTRAALSTPSTPLGRQQRRASAALIRNSTVDLEESVLPVTPTLEDFPSHPMEVYGTE